MASGLVMDLRVFSDLHAQLVSTVQILMHWHHRVTHFVPGVDKNGIPFLTLRWASDKNDSPLPVPIDNADAVEAQIGAWLKAIDWSKLREPDHDGDNSRGWIITNYGPNITGEQWRDTSFYDVLTVQPGYVEYHK